ncbi:MAG TPA: S8 family serine peptidase [Thermoleophilaceae bacterium]|jgi:subtilisin family serine protease|nr:S8 family serine peptidase [Thermoleophilaceae bacterium]
MPHLGPNGSSDLYGAGGTGRYLVLFEEGAGKAGISALGEAIGISVATVGPEGQGIDEGAAFFEELGVAVVDAAPEQIEEAGALTRESSPIIAIEPERTVYALEVAPAPPLPRSGNGGSPAIPSAPPTPAPAPPATHTPDYLQGYRDAVLHLTAPLPSATPDAGLADLAPAAVDESQATWGLQAVRAVNSCRSGRGIRLAVLDTGFDLQHPDFAGRTIQSQSFIQGEAVQDGHGHGTHCIGTSMGPKCARGTQRRYGVAYRAEIYSGKVLSNAGVGTDAQILAGINWAVTNQCAVISMSLGAPTAPGQAFSQVFETVASRAAQAGSLIVAAAGNDSQRPAVVNPVSHPANCPSIMAVAALDVNGAIAPFSNRGVNPNGGQIDVAGPGVDVYSSWPMPTRYRRISGTSMATPHAAGVAALLAEANPGVRGAALGRLLTSTAWRFTTLPSADVGAGLVRAP